MAKAQSFIMDDPANAIFRGVEPLDTRVLLSLTMYDLRVVAQMIALGAFPHRFEGLPETKAVRDLAARVGALVLDHFDEIWMSLTPEEQALGMGSVTGRPDDTV